MGIEPIHDGNSNDTKVMKIISLPSQCDRALSDIIETEQHSIVVYCIQANPLVPTIPKIQTKKTSILKQMLKFQNWLYQRNG